MKHLLLTGLAMLAGHAALADGVSTLTYPGLGTVAIEAPAGPPKYFVVFVSGDGGWNKGVVDMARHLASAGALVAGVDVRNLDAHAAAGDAQCVNLAASFEGLSHFVQQRLALRDYLAPVLVGYSSGATVAYATLAQAPADTFRGALSLGFCPDLEWSRPLCRGSGLDHAKSRRGYDYEPARHLQDPWIALQGEQDQVCAPPQTREFVARVPGAKLVSLPAVGHGYSVERNWVPQFLQAFHEIADPPARPVAATTATAPAAGTRPQPQVDDLPLIELPAARPRGDVYAIMLSGDGGWAGLDKEVAAQLNARGVTVVGWDSLRYFWRARTPAGAAADLDRVIQHYSYRWPEARVLLIGYSQGADVLPFMINRLPGQVRARIASTALIALSEEAFFEFSVSHWISEPKGGMPIAPELASGRLGRVECIHGADEPTSACRTAGTPGLRRVELPGGHHFDGDYVRVADAVLASLGS